MNELKFLETLEQVIDQRLSGGAENSYTARLAASGILAVAQKLGEEGVETALAAAAETPERVRAEAADLLFHLLVVLAMRDLRLADVVSELEQRHRP